MRITEKIFCLPMVSYIKGLLDMDKSGRIMLYFLNPRRDVWLLLTLQLAYIRLFATRHYTGFHCCVMLVMWHNVTLSLSPLSVSECSVCGRGPEWRVEPTLREDAALKTGSGRAGPGWAFASNIGRQWANREREREAGNGLVHTPGTEPQSAQFLGRLEPISILQHKRLSFISWETALGCSF